MPAIEEVGKILKQRGNAPRNYGNTLIFLVADRTRVEELKQTTRLFLAWNSIDQERESLNLDAFQSNQAKTRRKDAEDRIIALIPETYCWVLVPEQLDPRKPHSIGEYKLQPQRGEGYLVTNTTSLLRIEELLIPQLAGLRLRQELDRIPLWRGNHVSTKELIENFAKYIYMPRLKSSEVLLAAMRDGVQSPSWRRDTFAYASGWDEERQRYRNLRAGERIDVIPDGQSLLVKPEVAEAQLAAEAAELEAARQSAAASRPTPAMPEATWAQPSLVTEQAANYTEVVTRPRIPETPSVQTFLPIAQESQRRRFYGSISINERMMASDAGRIMEEFVKHLTSLSGAKVKVTLEIEAELSEGIPEQVLRTLKENGNALHFQTCEFIE